MRLLAAVALGLLLGTLLVPRISSSHLAYGVPTGTHAQKAKTAERNLAHARYVANRGGGRNKREHAKAIPWLERVVYRYAFTYGVPEWPWGKLAACESGRRWTYNGSSGFDGGLQFHPGTWAAYRRSGEPWFAYLAPAWQQVAVARRVLRAQGWNAWPACSRKLGLR